ncbi:PhzF family phenazine biosynthesis protein [Nonlabens ponticola]|uniref:PhzF family phenazine biosynthesis protein n=2 Tax=Nonlabens ponticola TaxID=2496866 RepID=A0A3S9N164_9FLAO|nr:PhzF family phenazine biosynthesis protein [Nonlabens ponticola]
MVDSFTNEPFKGNPAGVCLLEEPLDDALMQSIASEINLSETAFVLRSDDHFSIRYFSPMMEIPLCGHATLASAKVLFERDSDLNAIDFKTQSGTLLKAARNGEKVALAFPNYGIVDREVPKELLHAIGIDAVLNTGYNHENLELMIEIKDSQKLRKLTPDFSAMKAAVHDISGVVVTAKSSDPAYDFESRYFWPWSGGDEDPVTGATHTFLTAYWAEKLKKRKLKAYQCSARTGILDVEVLDDEHISITGDAVVVVRGELMV